MREYKVIYHPFLLPAFKFSILGNCVRFNFTLLLLLEEGVHCSQFLINIQYSVHACICVHTPMSVDIIHSCMNDCVFMTATLTVGV